MISVFGFRVRLKNQDLDFENLNPDFPIELTPIILQQLKLKDLVHRLFHESRVCLLQQERGTR